MKVLLVGLAIIFCIGAAGGLRCRVCSYRIPLVGCFHGANETACGPREKCALVRASLGRVTLYFQQGCTSALNCGRQRAPDSESRLATSYSCCDTDLCNDRWIHHPSD